MFGTVAKGGYHGIQMLGLMNALKTGDPSMDAAIAMCLPVILTQIVNQFSRSDKTNADTWWSRLNFLSKRLYKRSISYAGRSGTQSSNDSSFSDDSMNSFLIKAIKLYIHEHCPFDPKELDLELSETLGCSEASQRGNAQESPYQGGTRRRRVQANTNQGNTTTTSTFGMLQNCAIIQKPVLNRWHNLGGFDGSPVYLMISETSTENSNKRGSNDADDSESNHSVELKMKSGGPNSIDKFVHKAYEWYLAELKKEQCNDRFFYDLKGFEGRGSHRYPVYGKYTLSDEKTFQSLFSGKCHDLLKIVDQFQTKSGKYSIPGYPYKLGLLLHGPPGTGKTSLIKALAHYTNRHIVNVSLSRIETNNELMTLFFNQRYAVSGQGAVAPKMDFDQLIFVFEDIDASTEVVKRREAHDCSTTAVAEQSSPRATSSGTPRAGQIGNRMNSTVTNNSKTTAFRLDEDRLNLTGLLNVLDGVVDTPGRMVIMTSNHPQVLDPALIRPGRIDKKLELSHMASEDVVAMLEHYYQTKLSPTDQERVHQCVQGDGTNASPPLKLIPAMVEQVAMEEDTIEAMLSWLEAERRGTAMVCKSGPVDSVLVPAKVVAVAVATEEFSSTTAANSDDSF